MEFFFKNKKIIEKWYLVYFPCDQTVSTLREKSVLEIQEENCKVKEGRKVVNGVIIANGNKI